MEKENCSPRTLTHFWWVDWPDKGVPVSCNGIGALVTAVRAVREDQDAPILVHCSAGVGRTGCFLAIDVGMRQFDLTGSVDILAIVGRLRKDRGMTVQTFDQYRFVHRVRANTHKKSLFMIVIFFSNAENTNV